MTYNIMNDIYHTIVMGWDYTTRKGYKSLKN